MKVIGKYKFSKLPLIMQTIDGIEDMNYRIVDDMFKYQSEPHRMEATIDNLKGIELLYCGSEPLNDFWLKFYKQVFGVKHGWI